MKVLIACEESQRVCIAMRNKGHAAFSCDIEPCSGEHPEWHIQQDVLLLLNGNCEFETMDGETHNIHVQWDLLIAHPPCTYLSNAGACRLYPAKGVVDQERYQKGIQAKEFFMSIYNANCPRIAIENPVSCRAFNMPPYTQEIQPWQFGHDCTKKKTRLWLKGLPKLAPTHIVEPIAPYIPAETSRKDKRKYGLAKRGDDRKERAKTFPGIAEAMAEQWTI